MDPSRLVDLEEIKRLKARYFRTLDTKQWKEFGDVFTEERSRSNSKISRRHIQNLFFPPQDRKISSCAGIGKIRPESGRELDH